MARGINRQMLDGDSVSPREALARFLGAVGDRDVYSDNPDFDQHWLGALADAAGSAPYGMGEHGCRSSCRSV